MKKYLLFCVCFCLSGISFAATFDAHIRNRPPELTVNGSEYGGPLKDIIDLAAERSGHSVRWAAAPFKRSIEDLKGGNVDFVPRTFMREERKQFAHFLDPVGYQEKTVVFFVKKGSEAMVERYEDLAKVSIGVKRGTVYFKQFDKDGALKKVENTEDAGLARMLQGGRFDVMASIDPDAAVEQFKAIGFDYSMTNYKHFNRTGVYYASSKKRYEKDRKQAYDDVNKEIQKMVSSGEIDKIYASYGIEPPAR